MNPEPRSNYARPHIRFWCRGQIAVSARKRIDKILTSKPLDAQAMISEWVIRSDLVRWLESLNSKQVHNHETRFSNQYPGKLQLKFQTTATEITWIKTITLLSLFRPLVTVQKGRCYWTGRLTNGNVSDLR